MHFRACIVVFAAVTVTTSLATAGFASLGNTAAQGPWNTFILYNACAAVIVLDPVIIALLIKRTLAAVHYWPWIESENDALKFGERNFFNIALICVLLRQSKQ